MAKIQQPIWAKDAIPTLRGWERNGELLVSRKHSQQELDQYFGNTIEPIVENFIAQPVLITEAPINNISLEDMTKAQLEALGQQYGIDIKASKLKKQEMIELLEPLL